MGHSTKGFLDFARDGRYTLSRMTEAMAFKALERAVISAALLLSALAAAPAPASAELHLTDAQAAALGTLIWRNEGQGKVENLTAWNKGEDFASLGIGHFIWYPQGRTGPFTESFPALARFMAARGAPLPAWIAAAQSCPWSDRTAFYADIDGPRLRELRAALASSAALQARFIADRSEAALPLVLDGLPPARQAELRARYDAVAAAPNGVYALVDYVNFKGEGVSATERYDGLGWGLRQVLEEMAGGAAPGQAAVQDFSQAAARVLRRRVENAPPERGESRWLPGWLSRVKTYVTPL
jgi:hypothetical protein